MTRHLFQRPNRPQHTDPLRNQPDTSHDTPSDHPTTPIAVWQLDERTADQLDPDPRPGPRPDPDAIFASRLANQLVRIYTSHGDAVLDLDNDPHLCAATAGIGRTYLAITDTADIATLDDLHPADQQVGLVAVQWSRISRPDAAPPATTAAIADLFLACRLMSGGSATVIVAVGSATPTDIAAVRGQLLTAAETAGFAHTLQIIAVSSPRHGDAFTYYATPAEATHTAASQSPPSAGLLVFTPLPRAAVRTDPPGRSAAHVRHTTTPGAPR